MDNPLKVEALRKEERERESFYLSHQSKLGMCRLSGKDVLTQK